MVYTLEEQKTIDKALDTVLKDLELTWESFGKEEIEISIKLKGIKKENVKYPTRGWQIFLTKDGFYINNKFIENKICFTTIDSTGKMKPIYGMYELNTIFIKEYPELREKIISKTTKKKEERSQQNMEIQEQKERAMKAIKSLESMYSRTVDIEIDFPQTQNPHPIEIVEENGEKIGTLHFGGRTIRIITSGDIVLINKKEQKQKVNRK